MRIGTAKQGVDVFGFPGDGIVHFAGDGGVVLHGLHEVALMSAMIEVGAGNTNARAFAQKGNKEW
jgi:hypothetical protein